MNGMPEELILVKGYIHLVGKVRRKRVGGNSR